LTATAALRARLADEWRDRCRRSLVSLVRQGWQHAGLPGRFIPGRHITLICEELETITRSGHGRLLINAPPRSTKSIILGVFWPAWTWLQEIDYGALAGPWVQFLFISHRQDLVVRDSRRCRALIGSEFYQGLIDSTMRDAYAVGADTSDHFDLSAGGSRRSFSFHSAITGHDSDVQVIDDPHDVERVESSADRAHVHFVFDEVLPSRVNHPTRNAAVVAAQRTHVDDLSSHILESDRSTTWKHINIPGVAEPGLPDVLNRAPGQTYWAERFPDEATLRGMVRTAAAWSAQVQQSPQARGFSLFKHVTWRTIREWPIDAHSWGRYWDLAATGEGDGTDPDYTASALGCLDQRGVFYVQVRPRGRWSSSQIEQRLQLTARDDGRKVAIWIEEEPGASGRNYISHVQRNLLPGFAVRGDRATGSKLTALNPFVAAAEAGNIVLVDDGSGWVSDFIAEADAFTGDETTHDDQIIAAGKLYARLTQDMRIPSLTW